jgi:hypothetical protein
MEVNVSYYRGPDYIGHPLSDPARRRHLRAESSIVLNEAGAKFAYDLISDGKINFGPFTYDDPSDADQLYHLGADTSGGTGSKLYYPHGKDGEIYVEAPKSAIASGSAVVAAYAQQLLTNIQKQKAQSQANTPKRIAAGAHRYGADPEQVYWRHDGYLRLK